MKTSFQSSIPNGMLLILLYVMSRAPMVLSECTPSNLKVEESASSKRPDDIRILLSWRWSCQGTNEIKNHLNVLAQHISILDNNKTGIITVGNGCNNWKSGCEWNISNGVLSRIFQEETYFMPCSTYSFQVENSTIVSLWIKPGEENMKPQLNLHVKRDKASKDLLMSTELRRRMHPFCAHLVKEIQVSFNNTSSSLSKRSSPYILPCLLGMAACFSSFSLPQFDFCQSHSVQLRLVYDDGLESYFFNSTTYTGREDGNSDQEVLVVESNNPEALAIHWKDPCSLVPVGEWQILMKRLASNTISSVTSRNDSVKDLPSMMFHETIPVGCIKDEYQEGNNTIQHSLVLFKDQALHCQSTNLITRIFHYDSCGSYSIELKQINTDDSSYHSKPALVMNFTTFLDASDVWDLGVRNITSYSYELLWSIPVRCRALATMNITINNVSQVIEKKDLNQDCDDKSCRVFWKSDSLTPCTRYSINVGEKSISVTTYPDNEELKPSAIISAYRNGTRNKLELAVEVFKMNSKCAALVDFAQVVFAKKTVSSTETSQLLSCKKSPSNETVFCKGKYTDDNQLNLCQPHQVEVLLVFSGSLFSDRVNSIAANLVPSTDSLDEQKFTFIRVEQLDSQTLTLEWNNDCLMGNISYWNVLIQSPDHQSEFFLLLHIPYSCSEEFTHNHTKSNSSSLHRGHRIVLSHGQVTCNSPFVNTYGRVFNILPCSYYTIRVTPLNNENMLTEFSQEVNFTTIYQSEEEENLRSQLIVSVERAGASNNLLMMNISLNEKMHPRCASSLKEIQLFHNASRSSPYTLQCSNKGLLNQSHCSASFYFSQFDLCRLHLVQLRLIFNNGQQSELFNSTLDIAVARNTSDFKIVAVATTNPEALTIQLEDPCSLSPVGYWKILIKQPATDTNRKIDSLSNPLRDGDVILFNETLPASCIIDESHDKANNSLFRYSMILYKDKPFQCHPTNYTTPTFHYDPCSSYSIELEQKTSASYHPKLYLRTNFSTPIDASAVHNLTVTNLTSVSIEMSWLIPSKCSDSTQKGVEINREIQPLNQTDMSFKVGRKWKEVRWRNPKVLLPCKTYRIQVGSSVVNISTPIDFITGSVNNLTVKIMNSTSIDIRWDPPTCDRRINYWRLTLWSDYDNFTSTLVNITLPSTILFYTIDINIAEKIGMMENDSLLLTILESCQIYHVNVVTGWADGSSYEVEEIVPTECPPSIMTFWADGVGLGVIILLSSLGFTILTVFVAGVYYFQIRLRRRKREEADLSSDFRVIELNTYDFIPTSSSSF